MHTQLLSERCFKILLLCSAINAMYLSILFAFEIIPPHNFIYQGDLFADFLKVTLSYPLANLLTISDGSSLRHLASQYLANNPYAGIGGLDSGALTHFHLPPLTTVIGLLSVHLMKLFGVGPAFFGLGLMIFLAFIIFAKSISQSISDWKYWVGCFLLCYPFLFALQRGNFFSLITTVFIFYYVVQVIKKNHLMIAIVCLALAINIRPNAVFFLPFLLTLGFYSGIKRAIYCLLLAGSIFGVCLILAHSLYPDYGLTSFLKGLAIYHQEHVVGDGGDAFNSAPFILIKKAFGYQHIDELVGVVFSITIIFSSIYLLFKKSLNPMRLLFILTIAYLCGSPVFGDYHLLIFFIPIIALALSFLVKQSAQSPQCDEWILLTCLFLLASKNYWFSGGGISWLVLFNPLVAVVSSVWVLGYSFKNAGSTSNHH